MKIVIETSTLVSASIYWESFERGRTWVHKHKFYRKCNGLFRYFKEKGMEDDVIITKTVELEAKNALNGAVKKTIKENYRPDLLSKYKLMVLQEMVMNESLDRLETYVEEYSSRLPINATIRNDVKKNEIEPFMSEVVQGTMRYIQPSIPGFIRDGGLRDELTQLMVNSIPTRGVIYKGMPGDKDLTIMAEATLIHRKFRGKETIYVASMDNHFKPNPVQIGSFLSPNVRYTGELDSGIRDKVAEKFGFIGEDPTKILEIVERETTA
jgi:hypothetical protein